MSRWKVNKVGTRNTKRIPTKVLWYFPPIPRNLRLAISADGINPHSSMTSKTKDEVKSRLDLLEMGLRPNLAPRFGLKQTYLPPTCYTLSGKDKKVVLQTLVDLKVPKALLYSKVFLLLTMHEPCREKGAGNLKMEANFAAWRHPLVISCEFVKGSPRLKITLNGINFVDHFLNQGAPAEHKSVETPIGHESNGAAAGDESNDATAGDESVIVQTLETLCAWKS
ncbi:hypothetical protein CK203_110247 [Vitis vinifera]|uniref:Uncharacterized protein n=1 Tax=Vitis vinifera TaxID=29760 RepID=A0A438CFI6_VITVI|nr:hypothetical protein CK203_110247 [Vitis vinifera]